MRKGVLVLAAIALFACHSKDKSEAEVCSDSIDNDGDGLVDCADGDGCSPGAACGAGGATCSAQAACVIACAGDGSAEQCADAIDNDCDGVADCSDSDCATATACASATQSCGATDGAGRRVCLDASRTQLLADGTSAADLSVLLRVGPAPVAGATCTFSIQGVSGLIDGAATTSKTTDSAGRAAVVYTAGTTVGESRVVVSCLAEATQAPVTAELPMTLLGVGAMRVVGADHQVLGTTGSGYQEHSQITFQLFTPDGAPFPAGAPVQLSHRSHGGSYIGSSPGCEGNVCTVGALTDGQGKVSITLTSGREFAVLTVEAAARGGGRDAKVVAGGYAVVGAKANGAHISLDCRPYNVPAFTNHDCLYSRYAGEEKVVDCTVSLADRFGTVIGVPTLATLQSEAGNAGPAASTVPYDPAKPVSEQRGIGKALTYIDVYGHPLPRDVSPFSGEVSRANVDFGCGPKTVNPRDGLVTVIAIVAGEEGFVDRNVNGLYDEGESFIDIGEPFVDADDDGTRAADEPYEDVNGNGRYDAPNGKWDANTHIWAQTRVLYTGHPAREISAGKEFFSRVYLPPYEQRPELPLPPNGTSTTPWLDLPPEITQPFYGVFFTDDRYNPLASSTKYEAAAAAGNITVTMVGPDNTVDSLGTSFRQLYCESAAAPHGKCFHGPADSACVPAETSASRACFVVPDVGGCVNGTCPSNAFTLGNDAYLGLTCSTPSADVVSVTAEIEGVKSALFVNQPFGSERACGDGRDNDCDGASDCTDGDCAGSVACKLPPGSCTSPDSSGRSICMQPARARLPSDAAASTTIDAYALQHGFAVPGALCTFSTSGASGALDATSAVTDATGKAAVRLTAGSTAGRTTVTAACAIAGATTSTSVAVDQVAVGAVRVIAADYAVLGARSSGYQEHSVITFEALAVDGTPMPAGTRVEFTHERQGDSFIGEEGSCVSNPCTLLGETDAEGKTRVTVTSGRRWAVLTVAAKATTAAKSAQAIAGGYPVVGAKPNGAHLSLDCRPYNVPAFTVHDCLYSRYNGQASTVDCTVSLADRYGIVLGIPALAAFQSETGNMGPPAFTVGYDTTRASASQPNVGKGVGYMSVYGHPLPRDVEPWSSLGEYSVAGADFGCGISERAVNPRDGFVTVVAIVAGEEGFVDLDVNGEYDVGEPFVDVGEPFVDADDDGMWDYDEWFEDVNSNLVYDGPNGVWDSDTHLWTQTRVLYTGYPRLMDPLAAPQQFSRFYDADYSSPTMPYDTNPATDAFMQVGQMRKYGVFFTDDRLNPLTPEAGYAASSALGNAKITLVGPTYGIGDIPPDLFRMLYCSSGSAPYGTCEYGPADDACRRIATTSGSSTCYVVPDVAHCLSGACTGFPYGNRGTAFVGCEKPGMDAVTVSATIERSKHSISLGAYCEPAPTP